MLQLEHGVITWHIPGVLAPTDISVVPLEAIRRIWASIRFERPVACLQDLEHVIGTFPFSAGATAAVAPTRMGF